MEEYKWGKAPENLQTKKQLAEAGLRPGGPIVAQLVWGRGKTSGYANLYDVAQAVSKKAASPAQLAALEKARQKLRSCPRCGYDLGFVPGRNFSAYECPQCFERKIERDRTGMIERARYWVENPEGVIILDTETTDLDGYVVQLAAIDLNGGVVFDSLINPLVDISPEAQAVHGITAEMLRDAPTFSDVSELLRPLLSQVVLVYNADFDKAVLKREFDRMGDDVQFAGWLCVMRLYTQYFGEWSDYHRDYRWQPLPYGDHSALGDCQGTLRLLREMAVGEAPVFDLV